MNVAPPEAKYQQTKYPPPSLPRVKGGHQASFLAACQGGEPAASNFGYSGPLAEIVLLGNIAIRTKKTFTGKFKE